MMDIEEIIRVIADTGNIEDMRTLSDILEELMKIIQKYDTDCYNKYAMELYTMAYGETLSPEMAEKIVRSMKPYGEKWNMQETKSIQDRYGFSDLRTPDVYVVMNSAYNDYKNIFEEDTEKYVKFTIDFIEDEDAGEGKVFKYFTIIPRMED